MSHKVHPKIFRTKETKDWNSRWLSKKEFPKYLKEDFKIREFLSKVLKEAAVEKIEIERFPGKINIVIESARPGLIIGRGGKGIEELKKKLDAMLKPIDKEKREIRLEIKEIRNSWKSAKLSAQWVASQLEKRVYFRRVLKQTMDKIMTNKEIKGARVEISGRLGGAEIARREWLKKGRLPRQTLRADIDYGRAEANCTYGVIGIKVWIYKGERIA
jgi:small subunit ribosomal protein S3